MLHLQENVALARKCCIGKKMLQLQENLAFSGKKMLHLQENFLQMQHFLATKSKIFLQLQHFLANATFSCQFNIFLPLNVKVHGNGLAFHQRGSRFEFHSSAMIKKISVIGLDSILSGESAFFLMNVRFGKIWAKLCWNSFAERQKYCQKI